MKKKLNPRFLDMAEYSHAIDKIEAGEDIQFHGGKTVRIKSLNDFCFVSIEDTRVVICIQGSNDKKDWIGNVFKFLGKKNFLIYHQDFYNAAEALRYDICKILDQHDDKKIYISCYSRGAGIGVFVAMFLSRDYDKLVKLMGFGCPKVLGPDERDEFNDLNIHFDNVQNFRDPVCQAGGPFFKTVGIVKNLKPLFNYFIPFNWIERHKFNAKYGYYYNIKRLSE